MQENRIVDAGGADVVLRGVAVIDPLVGRGIRYHSRLGEQELETLARDWRAAIVRVPMHPDLMAHHPAYLRDFVDPLVEWAGEQKLYLLLGYHAHGNPAHRRGGGHPLGLRSPLEGQPPTTPTWSWPWPPWPRTAARYRDRPWVLYSVFNEPAFISWGEWRPLAERLVDAVRDPHPGALVLVSGVHWASELDGALADPVRREGIVYEIHPYPWVGESWKRVVAELSMRHPVFLGEWGFGDEHPASERNYGEALVGYCEEMGLGWTAWIWDHSWTPSMFTSASRARLTPFGALVKRSLAPGKRLYSRPGGIP